MTTRPRWLLRMMVGVFLAAGVAVSASRLDAFESCCKQCTCVQLCCDPDAPGGCGSGGGSCSTISDSNGSGCPLSGGCSFTCGGGTMHKYCCADYCGYEMEG